MGGRVWTRFLWLASLAASLLVGCAEPEPRADARATPPERAAEPAPAPAERSRLEPRADGRARLFYFERWEDNFLTRRVMDEAPALAVQWPEMLEVRRLMNGFLQARGELGSTISFSKRAALEYFPGPDDEQQLAAGRTTVILENGPGEPPFTPADKQALAARLARFPQVRVVLVEEIVPPPALQARERAVEGSFDQDDFQERLVRAACAAPIEEWEQHLGQRLHVGDVIDYEPSRYRGVYTLMVGERPGADGQREACVLLPYHGGEFYVTPPAYLSCPDRIPFGYWSGDELGYKVDCFPVQHAWLRARAAGEQVPIDGRAYPIPPAVRLLLADADDGGFQVYVNPEVGELWTFERRTTYGER